MSMKNAQFVVSALTANQIIFGVCRWARNHDYHIEDFKEPVKLYTFFLNDG